MKQTSDVYDLTTPHQPWHVLVMRIKWNRASHKRFYFHKIGVIMTQYYYVFWPHFIGPCLFVKSNMCLGYGKTENEKRATCFATLLQIELNNDVAQQIGLLTRLNIGGKTRNIAIQLDWQQCCKTSYTFFVARFSLLCRMIFKTLTPPF